LFLSSLVVKVIYNITFIRFYRIISSYFLYLFATLLQAMRHAISDKKFIEHAEVHGCLYGTSIESVESVWRSNRICLLDIDVNGVKQIKKVPSFNARYVFIMPPDMEELEKRLRDRGTESSEQIDLRLKNAEDEMEYATGDDEPFDLILVNDNLDESEKMLLKNMREWFPDRAW
jgi:guanylate kinase